MNNVCSALSSHGLSLPSGLVPTLVDCGRIGHAIAMAHHNDPGSNGHTFGAERYQRSTELVSQQLHDFGFEARRIGAGLRAFSQELILEFAVARGTNLHDRSVFDADSSPGRVRAGAYNAQQLTLPGLPEMDPPPIVHVVWSGTPEDGLTATHMGRLVANVGSRLDWDWLVPVDTPTSADSVVTRNDDSTATFLDQPVPAMSLRLKERKQADEA